MSEDAIKYYHDLLNDQLAAEADGQMRLLLRERGLYFGERPLCTVLRPHFYMDADWSYLKQQTEILLGAFARAHDVCVEVPELRAQLALQDYEERLFSLDDSRVVPWTSSRLDSFFTVDSQTLKYVEYNAETPAGMGYGDKLAEVFFELEIMRRFQERYHVRNMPMLDDLLTVLVDTYKHWGGQPSPQIAIVDWHDVPTLNEHEICREWFERSGFRTILADPRELEFRGDALWARDFRIDLVYKRVLYSELIGRMGIDNPLVEAVRQRAVFMTNSFSAKLMAKKASFAFLSDERNAYLFTDEQRVAIEQHIPWTRLVSERKTVYSGMEVDLIPFVLANRERFVLKPNDEYGGKGVTLGWESSESEWAETLHRALFEPYVVQERVPTIIRDFPAYLDDKLDISPRFVDANPYIFYGKRVYGCLTRLSSVALLNVTAGGGSVVPTFVIDRL